jgi:hypothetical protein
MTRMIFKQSKLDHEEIAFVASCVNEPDSDSAMLFGESSAYEKLMDYFQDEMPLGVSQGDTGEPDMWIIDYLATCI